MLLGIPAAPPGKEENQIPESPCGHTRAGQAALPCRCPQEGGVETWELWLREAAPSAPSLETDPLCSPELITPPSQPQGQGVDRDQSVSAALCQGLTQNLLSTGRHAHLAPQV